MAKPPTENVDGKILPGGGPPSHVSSYLSMGHPRSSGDSDDAIEARATLLRRRHHFPHRALDRANAAAALKRYPGFRARLETLGDLPQYPKVHLLADWVQQLVRNPVIIDTVSALLGPDLLCWSSTFFAKRPRDPHYVGWHQDATYWGLEPTKGVATVWLALSSSTRANGCMQVVKGSHQQGQLSHANNLDADNLLQSGQELVNDIRACEVTDVELEPGEFSVHHALLIHGSRDNPSPLPRVGLSIQYIAAEVRQTGGWDSATAVAGKAEAKWGERFELEPTPLEDFGAAAVAAYERALEAPSGLGRAAKLNA